MPEAVGRSLALDMFRHCSVYVVRLPEALMKQFLSGVEELVFPERTVVLLHHQLPQPEPAALLEEQRGESSEEEKWKVYPPIQDIMLGKPAR